MANTRDSVDGDRPSIPSHILEAGSDAACAEPIEQHLRNGKHWLNGGECCGQKDCVGTCLAPACIFGEALKWFFAAADEIERQQSLRHATEAEIADAVRIMRPFINRLEGFEELYPNRPDNTAVYSGYKTPLLGHLRAARAFVEKHYPAIRNRAEAK